MRRASPRAVARRALRTAEGIPGLRRLPTAVVSRELGRSGSVRYDRRHRAFRHTSGGGVIFDSRPRAITTELFRARVDEVFAPHVELRPGDVVVDVGAGIGTESQIFADRVGPGGLVLAIEAHPATFRLLELNTTEPVVRVQAAAGEAPGRLRFTSFAGHEANYGSASAGGVEVEVVRLDDLPEVQAIRRLRLLKSNIEGAETAMLRGAPDLLARTDAVSISCHDFKADREGIEEMRTRAAVVELLVDAGFELEPRVQHGPGWLRDTVRAVRTAAGA